MNLDELSTSLYREMEEKLEEIGNIETNYIQVLKNTITTILNFLSKLKEHVTGYKFEHKTEEIYFFKNIKPKFLSKLLYYQKLLEIHSRLPIASTGEMQNFYLNEMIKINEYLLQNKEFYIYYRSFSTSLDEIYFIRKEPDSWLLLNFENYETDLNFTTIYDHKLSKIIALELISEFIKNSIDKLQINTDKIISQTADNTQKISWTGSKVSLIELLYALQSTGSCNNGTVDIKHLASSLESFFNIDLGNYYRVFQEIRIRKISRTTFLDQLKERLIQRMDQSDENPKFK